MDYFKKKFSGLSKLIVFVLVTIFIAMSSRNYKTSPKLVSTNITTTNQKLPKILFNRIDRIPEDTVLPPFNKTFKSPCWTEEIDSKTRIRCLPYFYLVGMPKCGTSDFYSRITSHPSISNTSEKGTHWLSRTRFKETGNARLLSTYLSYFDSAITKDVLKSKQKDGHFNGVFGDFSGTYWDNRYLLHKWNGSKGTMPPKTLADVIYKLNPDSKIIFLIRNPVDRLYSEYLYFGDRTKKSMIDFHSKIKAAIHRHRKCLEMHCLNYCSYFFRNDQRVRLEVSIYHVYIEDYFRVFPRSQVKIVKMENYSASTATVLSDVFSFLGFESPPEEIMTSISHLDKKHDNKETYEEVGQMLPETTLLLSKFYKPYNDMLGVLLGENKEWN